MLTMPVDQITVEDRHRTDLGDLTSLAQSIHAVGLLHPVVVTETGRLIAASHNGRPDGAILSRALTTSIDAWGVRYEGVQKDILGGLGIVHETYGSEVDHAALVKKLAKFPGGASGLLGKARMLKEIRTGSMARLVASVIVTVYNRGRRADTLGDL